MVDNTADFSNAVDFKTNQLQILALFFRELHTRKH